MKKTISMLIMGLCVSSCIFSQIKDENNDFWDIAKESLERKSYVIPDSLFSFFPDKSDKYTYLKTWAIYDNATKMEKIYERTTKKGYDNATKAETSFNAENFNGYRVVETYQCENIESLQQLMKEYRLRAIYTVKSEITNYFVIDSERELYKKYDTQQLQERYLMAKDKLVLSFQDSFKDTPFLYDTTTISRLPVGYEILVLKSGSDFVLPQGYRYEWPILPDNLKHGYRSGVAFKESEPYIIYWTVAW